MKPKFVLILPNIRSGHNVGAMFRTGDGCGVGKIYLVGYSPCPPHPQVDKVSLGAEKTVPWEHHKQGWSAFEAAQSRWLPHCRFGKYQEKC